MDTLRKEMKDVWDFYMSCSKSDTNTRDCHRVIFKKIESYEQKYMGKIPTDKFTQLVEIRNMHKEYSKNPILDYGYPLAFVYGQLN